MEVRHGRRVPRQQRPALPANNQQAWFLFHWFDAGTNANHWVRPSVNHTPFSSRQAQLIYLQERAFWDWDQSIPASWGLLLQSVADSDFVFSLIVVTN